MPMIAENYDTPPFRLGVWQFKQNGHSSVLLLRAISHLREALVRSFARSEHRPELIRYPSHAEGLGDHSGDIEFLESL